MQPFVRVGGVDRYHQPKPSAEQLAEIIQKFDLHELVEEDLLEVSTQDKIDVYDQCLFAVLHFPKYNETNDKYVVNEFNVVMTKEYIMTLTARPTKHIDQIKDNYEKEIAEIESDEEYKISPYFILYRLIDVMYDKVLRGTRLFARDLASIEESIFSHKKIDKQLLEQIMVKRRNIVSLKHTLSPQNEILEEMQEATLKFFGGELDVYFEDLQYKLDKILNTLTVLSEDIDSLYDTHNAIVSMKINSIITMLTIFTAVLWVLTLVTGFYGMNVGLPGAEEPYMYAYIIAGMMLLGGCMLAFFNRKKWL